MVAAITPGEFMELRGRGERMLLLDVREPWETRLAPVPTEHVRMPMSEIQQRLDELDPQLRTVVICRSGGRSLQVAHFLERRGFSSVANLTGGILAWASELDPTIPRY
ncbi:MAG: sulfurtransferase [Gammaproteobacteria bacterium]|nr:sulfurtransferase [Gammaproteobacteria bacterium]